MTWEKEKKESSNQEPPKFSTGKGENNYIQFSTTKLPEIETLKS